ncbi:MAG: adenylate kinase [Erysipelothrix sp.]
MIVILTGASHTGKTALAQHMLEKYKYPVLSIDLLKMGLIRSHQTELTPNDDLELEYYLWPIVSEIIKTAVENNQNLIVEGCYIPARWYTSFTEETLKHIQSYCLVMSQDYIKGNFDQIKEFASVIERRLDDSWCTLESTLAENAAYEKSFVESKYQKIIYIDVEYDVSNCLEDFRDDSKTQ